MGLSKMAKTCRKCPYQATCTHKQMEAFAYLPDRMAINAAPGAGMGAAAPVLRSQELRNIYIDVSTTVTIDLVDAHRELERELYKDFDIYRGLLTPGG